jgi:hypothetical protein
LVVTNLTPRSEGQVAYETLAQPQIDPLGLVQQLAPEVLGQYRSERQWLEMTYRTQYPDAVVSLARHMLWDEELVHREREFAPDLVVTAREGWYFGTAASPGTMHGYPSAEATRASWFVSGPGVRRGTRIETPCRLVDLTPTILDMVGLWDTVGSSSQTVENRDFDGTPIREIYTGKVEYVASAQPVYHDDVDLGAWGPLTYTPLLPSTRLPRTINNPAKPLDLNNLVFNVAMLSDASVFRLLDDALMPIAGNRRYVTNAIDRVEERLRRQPQAWITSSARVPDVGNLAPADYSFTSQGNLQRVNQTIDWIQDRSLAADSYLARPLHLESLPLTPPVMRSIDFLQEGFWETYQLGQRVVVQTVDYGIISRVEASSDWTLQLFQRVPAEIQDDTGDEFMPTVFGKR